MVLPSHKSSMKKLSCSASGSNECIKFLTDVLTVGFFLSNPSKALVPGIAPITMFEYPNSVWATHCHANAAAMILSDGASVL